jgi:hypothetical protein
MTVLSCPRCRRANPADAAYCYFDGAGLRSGGDGGPPGRLPHEFVFPSGRRCRSYDELALACQDEWDVARGLLAQGAFRQYFSGTGRLDLARRAEEAAAEPDADQALDAFLAELPAQVSKPPQLDLNPRRIQLGAVRAGDTRSVTVQIQNQGQGLLHGTLTVEDGGSWLTPADGEDNAVRLRTSRHQDVVLRIDTRHIPAPQTYTAKLTVITNGGAIEVPVRLDLTVNPFPHAPFQGAASPRELAERLRAQPKAAVPLLEDGTILGWFSSNGWTYPVTGLPARGVAAVQQFFEGMGLSRPPTVQLSEADVTLRGPHGGTLSSQVTLRTTAKKWVYAHIESDVPWLRPVNPRVSGPQQAAVAFEADTTGVTPNRPHDGRLRIEANGGQVLTLRVRVEPQGVEKPVRQRTARQALLVGALAALLLRLLLAGPVDLYARLWAAAGAVPLPGSAAFWALAPVADAAFVRHVALTTAWLGAALGFVHLRRKGPRTADAFFGAVAGGVAGLAVAATVACLWPALDFAPRRVWQGVAAFAGSASPWISTPAWIVVAGAVWGLAGAAAGVVLHSLRSPALDRVDKALPRPLRRLIGMG